MFWARILARKGVAPEAVPRARLSTSALSRAVSLTLKDHSMRQRAAVFSALIHEEDGVGRAADGIEAIGAGVAVRRFEEPHPA
jgi:UDP:flavonoid glycosyltransferase YjiC (YdhE family)